MTATIKQRITHVPAGVGTAIWMSGGSYSIKIGRQGSSGSLAFIEASVPPGAGPMPHVHTDADEAYFVLSGEIEVLDGDTTFRAKAGDFVFIPRNTLHRFRNPGLHTVRMIFLFTPAGFEGFFEEAGLPATPGIPAPPIDADEEARVLRIAPQYHWKDHVSGT